MQDHSEVKGLWFVSAKRYAIATYGTLAVEEMISVIGPEAGRALASATPSAWYPEAVLQDALRGMREVLAGGDPARMIKVLEGASLLGVNRFISSILGMVNPAFVLRRVPVLWRHLRRGPAHVVVETEGSMARIHYSNFPYFGDENYQLLTIGALQALVVICNHEPRVRVVSQSRSHLSAEVTWNGNTQVAS